LLKLRIDFETYSEVDINLVGAFKYIDHSSTRPLCMSYKINDEQTKLWTDKLDIPEDLQVAADLCSSGQGKAYAFNATFDLTVWNKLMADAYDLPVIPLENWVDVQALCARFKLPQNLLNAGRALGCATEKMAVGKVLIRKCCIPGGNPTTQNFIDLGQYCIVDTDVMTEVMERLPVDYLTPQEQQIWEMTYKINERGVPVDPAECNAIIKYLKIYMEGQVKILPELTNGFVTTPGQIQKIKAFCAKQGVEMPNLSAEIVTEFLAMDDLPDVVRSVLRLRQELGKSSVKKFLTIAQMQNRGRVQGNLNYHGAGTGRWAGRGFQYHNLPRAKTKEPEVWLQRFIDREPMEDPVEMAKALIRPMIKAPQGQSLIVSDYSSIENRFLAWLAGDELTLQGFRNDFDQYKDMASFLYDKPVEDIAKSERQLGKALILGCGYGMSFRRFVVAAQTYGVFIDDNQARIAVDAYRKKYYLIVKMWYRLANAVMNAVKFPGKKYESNRCECSKVKDKVGHSWLRITLPSGRALMYMDPHIGQGKYGPAVYYKGQDQKTFQWTNKELTPGLITENVTQAGSRDVLCEGMLELQSKMPEAELILCVHDEVGTVIHDSLIDDTLMERFNTHFCVNKEYRHDLPLKAEGYISRRYRKD